MCNFYLVPNYCFQASFIILLSSFEIVFVQITKFIFKTVECSMLLRHTAEYDSKNIFMSKLNLFSNYHFQSSYFITLLRWGSIPSNLFEIGWKWSNVAIQKILHDLTRPIPQLLFPSFTWYGLFLFRHGFFIFYLRGSQGPQILKYS